MCTPFLNKGIFMYLKQICKSISNTYNEGKDNVIFLNTRDILNGHILNSEYSSLKNLPGQAKKTICNEDILLSEIRPKNNRFAFVKVNNPEDYILSTKLMVIRCDKQKVNPRYIYSFLTSPSSLLHLEELAEARSGTFPQITFDEIASLEISLPSLEKQQHIVDIISSA